jgi:hypothetical protein
MLTSGSIAAPACSRPGGKRRELAKLGERAEPVSKPFGDLASAAYSFPFFSPDDGSLLTRCRASRVADCSCCNLSFSLSRTFFTCWRIRSERDSGYGDSPP